MAAAFVPVPYLNGALMGSMLIMGTYELSKHPDSACMQPDLRAKTLNRTWKHLATGTLLSGAGWSLAQLAGGLQVGLPLALGGTVLGLLVVYSDACFAAAPLPGNRQPLVTAAGAPAA
ncbi:MAG TPA: hypothetical protein VLF94_07830 [Chlamydiales bacterium]|nr:hypothetical protein [Chlamydiales bacterium]